MAIVKHWHCAVRDSLAALHMLHFLLIWRFGCCIPASHLAHANHLPNKLFVHSTFQVPAEAYAEFAKSGERGAAARTAWEATRAAYAQKYPEEYAEFESIMTGKLPANWAENLPKFTSEGECE